MATMRVDMRDRDGGIFWEFIDANVEFVNALGPVAAARYGCPAHDLIGEWVNATIDGQSVTGWFTEDFTLAELKTLRARERLPQLRPASAAFDGQAQILTFEEVWAIAQAGSKRTGRTIGVYPELKHPTYFAAIGLATEDRLVAKLKALEAQAELAQITYDRDLRQFKAQAVSQQVVDTDAANLKNAQALAGQQRAIVDQKTLKAPFAGQLGIRQIDLGQYLSPGTPVVTLQALSPIYIDFLLPQQQVAQIKVGQKVTARVDAFPDRTYEGEIFAINPKIEIGTRNVIVRATVGNEDHSLLPGMFARVDIAIGAPRKEMTLPQTAIVYNAYGNLVYVVDESGEGPPGADGKPMLTVKQVFVETGATRGDQVAILKGVKDGDTIVSSGQMKLRNGAPIVVNNTIVPKDDAKTPRSIDP